MSNGDSTNFKEKLLKYWDKFSPWFFKLNIEQRFLLAIGTLLIFSGWFISIKSNPAIVAGALLIIFAALNPSTFKDFVLKVGKGGTEVSFKRRVASEEESEILKEATQKNPPPKIKIESEKLIEAAEKRTADERAPEDYLALAVKAWEEKKFEEGLRWAYSGLNLEPKNKETQVGLYNILGILYQNLKSYELSEENYKKALEIDGEAFGVHNNLGSVYSAQKKYDDAEREYKEALRLYPEYVNAHNGLGIVYLGQKKSDDAEREYKEALRLDPNYSNAHNGLGNVHFDKKKYNDAEREFKEAIRLDPDYCGAHTGLGLFFYQQKNFPEAELEYREALRLDPKYVDAHGNYGFLLFDLEKHEGALNHFNSALEIEAIPDSYAGKAICLSKLGRQEEALSTYKTAVSQNSKYLDLTQMREENVWSEQACEVARELIERL